MLRHGVAAAARAHRSASLRGAWTATAAAAAAAATAPQAFDVLRLAPGGGAPELAAGVAAAELGVAPRDASLFRRAHFCAPPATLTWRGDALYVRLEPYKAILRESEALLFDARRGAVASAARDAAAAARSSAGAAPFRLAVLESLLGAAAAHARGRLLRLSAASDAALADLSHAAAPGAARASAAAAATPSGETFARLVPLTRALEALSSDVAELHDAVAGLARDRPALANLAKSSPRNDAQNAPNASPDDAAALVDTYLRQVRAVGGELRELRQHIAATREVWELQLDGTRNRLHRLELHANFAVLGLTLAAVPAAMLGMNVPLPAGLEASAAAFPAVLGAAAAAGAGAFAAGTRWARAAGPAGRAAAQEGAAAARAMAAVLASLDDIEDALRAAGGGLSRAQLLAALRQACPGRFEGAGELHEEELSLIFNIFDTDTDGRLTLAEWVPHRAAAAAAAAGLPLHEEQR